MHKVRQFLAMINFNVSHPNELDQIPVFLLVPSFYLHVVKPGLERTLIGIRYIQVYLRRFNLFV